MEVEYLEKLAEFFKVFGDRTRLNILKLLLEQELNVTEISEKLDMNSSAISHQLRVLRAANLVKTRKDGKEVFYMLSDDHVKKIYEVGLEHVME
ncbi:helix-turn-helix transcriptional regulator [Sebaldella sp. S0638]|uniref:ArsR/SmtB family transcription factor n=1 Tax=Sebaldella sp. S0638 TaxID=2957809 RepID=UPI00209C7AE9|nr:metalloregulator ArsR/SmtB family transcription factor [Sebaldella sp. S0638]MCP1224698.1 metalloregulator ArsR/SmtB family transcription factor [Sebaldella sp. S0638]